MTPTPTSLSKGKRESDVNIKSSGKGFIIDVMDKYTQNRLAVTKEELEKIILYGQAILKEKHA